MSMSRQKDVYKNTKEYVLASSHVHKYCLDLFVSVCVRVCLCVCVCWWSMYAKLAHILTRPQPKS